MPRDLNDQLREEGVKAVRQTMECAQLFVAADRSETSNPDLKFPMTRFKDIVPGEEPDWAVKGVLPGSGLAVVYGPSNVGKTFLALVLAMRIALGGLFAGRKVNPTRVVYISYEGASGLRRRIDLLRNKLDLPDDLPFDLITATPNLGTADGDASRLIEEIQWQQKGLSPPVGVVFIDTLAKAMEGAPENSVEGMGAFLANADAVAKAFNCLVVAIHHTGKDASKGARGHYSLFGAADTVWELAEVNGQCVVTVQKQRDGESDLAFTFRLETHEVGRDKDGEPITTCIAAITSDATKRVVASKPRERRKGRSQIEFMDAFNEALRELGSDYVIDGDGPTVKAVRVDQVYRYFDRRWAVDEQDKRARQKRVSAAFRSAIKAAPDNIKTRFSDGVEMIWSVR